MYLDVLADGIPLRRLGQSPRPHRGGGGAVGANVSTRAALSRPLLQNARLRISQPPRPQPRPWPRPRGTLSQPLSLGHRHPVCQTGTPPPPWSVGATGGEARVEATPLAQAEHSFVPPAPTLPPFDLRGPGPGGAPAGDTGLLLPARRRADERYVRPRRAGLGAPGPPFLPPPSILRSSRSAPAWGLQRHLCEARPRPSPASSCCCLCLRDTRVDRSPTITEARLHFPGGSRRPDLPSPPSSPDKFTLQGLAQRLLLGRSL